MLNHFQGSFVFLFIVRVVDIRIAEVIVQHVELFCHFKKIAFLIGNSFPVFSFEAKGIICGVRMIGGDA